MNLADTPTTWVDPEPLSTLSALLVFAGIPLLVIAVVTLLVMAPSLANGPRYRPGQEWDGAAEWFGAPALTADQRPRLTSGAAPEVAGTGGASARW